MIDEAARELGSISTQREDASRNSYEFRYREAKGPEPRESDVEFNRNHYLLAGTVILLLGIQLRVVDSYVLNSKVSEFLLTMKGNVSLDEPKPSPLLKMWMNTDIPLPKTTFHPPSWIGWALMSVGSVLVLHSLAMKPPGG